MNVNTMRFADVWLGRAACFILTVFQRVQSLLGLQRTPRPDVRKILFIKLIEQGATVLACDALRRAADRVGRENVYFCVFSENRPVLDLLDLVPPENIIAIRADGFLTLASDMLRSIIRLRQLRLDAAIDLEFFSRGSAVLAYLSGASRRIGCHRFTTEGPYRGDLMTHRVQYNPYLHTAPTYSLLVETLDLDPGDIPLPKIPAPDLASCAASVPKFTPPSEDLATLKKLFSENRIPEDHGPIILLNPNASDLMPLRKWPTERFIELGKRIIDAYPTARIIVTGAPGEQDSAEEAAQKLGDHACSLAGKTTFRQLLTLYSLSNILITNDSGPGHFAAMTNIYKIVLFGPETPKRYGPLGDKGAVLWNKLACSPCVNAFNHRFSPCRLNRCMLAISVNDVFQEVARHLQP